MIQPDQIRAARSLLGINQSELARRAKVGVATVKRVEGSEESLRVTVDTLLRLQRALEAAGIAFIPEDDANGPGVRLKKPRK
jgi:transcriptional regulator with XRE-family HTH domain